MSKPIDAPRAWGWTREGKLIWEATRLRPPIMEYPLAGRIYQVKPVRIVHDRDLRRIMRENRELRERLAESEAEAKRLREQWLNEVDAQWSESGMTDYLKRGKRKPGTLKAARGRGK